MQKPKVLVIATPDVSRTVKKVLERVADVKTIDDIIPGETHQWPLFSPDDSDFKIVNDLRCSRVSWLLGSTNRLRNFTFLLVESHLGDDDWPWGLEVLRLVRYGGTSGFIGHAALLTFEPARTLKAANVPPRGRHRGASNVLVDTSVRVFRLPQDCEHLVDFVQNTRGAVSMCPGHYRLLAHWDAGVTRLSKCLGWHVLFIDDEICETPGEAWKPRVVRSAAELMPDFFNCPGGATALPVFGVIKSLAEVFLGSGSGDGLGGFYLAGGSFAEALIRGDEDVRSLFNTDRDGTFGRLDCVFVDVLFRGESYDARLLASLKAVAPHLPVFVLSAATEPTERGGHGTKRNEFFYPVRAMELGASGYFSKRGFDQIGASPNERAQELFLGVVRALAGRDWRREYFERFAERVNVIKDHTASLTREEHRYLLFKLFDGADKIEVISRPSAGLSDTDKYFVRATKGGRIQTVKLVKIGNRFEMREEKRNHDDIIEGYVDTFVARIRDLGAEAAGYAALSYTSVGRSQDYENLQYPRTFKEYLRAKCHEAEEEVAKGLADNARIDAVALATRAYETVLKQLYTDRQQCCPATDTPHVPELLAYQYLLALPAERQYCLVPSAGEQLIGYVDEVEPERANKIKLWVREADRVLPVRVEVLRADDNAEGARLFDELMHDPRLDRRKELRLNVKPVSNLATRTTNVVEQALQGKALANGGPVSIWTNRDFSLVDFRTQLGSSDTPDPLEFLAEHLQRPHRVRWIRSTIHGDLNLGNILVSERSGDTDIWLTDFARTRRAAHTAIDLSKLEVEIRTHILADILDRRWRDRQWQKGTSAWSAVWEILKEFWADENRLLDDGGDIREVIQGPQALVLYSAVRAVRQIALTQLEMTPEEYLFGLLCYSVRACSFKNLIRVSQSASAPLPVLLAYSLACVCSARLKAMKFLPSDIAVAHPGDGRDAPAKAAGAQVLRTA